jgi:hypothetical protein
MEHVTPSFATDRHGRDSDTVPAVSECIDCVQVPATGGSAPAGRHADAREPQLANSHKNKNAALSRWNPLHENRHHSHPKNLMTRAPHADSWSHHRSSIACAATGFVGSSCWRASRLHAGQQQVVTQPASSVCATLGARTAARRTDSRLHTAAVARADAAWGGCAGLGL